MDIVQKLGIMLCTAGRNRGDASVVEVVNILRMAMWQVVVTEIFPLVVVFAEAPIGDEIVSPVVRERMTERG